MTEQTTKPVLLITARRVFVPIWSRPGIIPTEMTQRTWNTAVFRRQTQEMRPLDRDGTVEDVANVIYFLASPEGSYLQAQTIALDGGWSTTKYLSPEALHAERR